MIRFKTGDMLAEDVDAMVNTVNCVGVMETRRRIAIQAGVSKQLQSICGVVQAWRDAPWRFCI